MNDARSLMAGINALRMGYAQKSTLNPNQVICPPWTRKDVSDMLDIRASLDWLLSEIRSGACLTEKDHGWLIRSIGTRNAALERKENDFLAKAGFNPNQPRVAAGSPEGGEWTDGGGGTTQPASQKPRRSIIGELFGIPVIYSVAPGHQLRVREGKLGHLHVGLSGGDFDDIIAARVFNAIPLKSCIN